MVNAAKLRLYKLGTDSSGQVDRKIRITVSQLKLEPRRPHGKGGKPVMLDSMMVDARGPGWLSLDVTGAVSRWHKHTNKPMALMVQVEDDKKKSLLPNSYIQPLNCDTGVGREGGREGEREREMEGGRGLYNIKIF